MCHHTHISSPVSCHHSQMVGFPSLLRPLAEREGGQAQLEWPRGDEESWPTWITTERLAHGGRVRESERWTKRKENRNRLHRTLKLMWSLWLWASEMTGSSVWMAIVGRDAWSSSFRCLKCNNHHSHASRAENTTKLAAAAGRKESTTVLKHNGTHSISTCVLQFFFFFLWTYLQSLSSPQPHKDSMSHACITTSEIIN